MRKGLHDPLGYVSLCLCCHVIKCIIQTSHSARQGERRRVSISYLLWLLQIKAHNILSTASQRCFLRWDRWIHSPSCLSLWSLPVATVTFSFMVYTGERNGAGWILTWCVRAGSHPQQAGSVIHHAWWSPGTRSVSHWREIPCLVLSWRQNVASGSGRCLWALCHEPQCLLFSPRASGEKNKWEVMCY